MGIHRNLRFYRSLYRNLGWETLKVRYWTTICFGHFLCFLWILDRFLNRRLSALGMIIMLE